MHLFDQFSKHLIIDGRLAAYEASGRSCAELQESTLPTV